jgi:hypothetical protein
MAPLTQLRSSMVAGRSASTTSNNILPSITAPEVWLLKRAPGSSAPFFTRRTTRPSSMGITWNSASKTPDSVIMTRLGPGTVMPSTGVAGITPEPKNSGAPAGTWPSPRWYK